MSHAVRQMIKLKEVTRQFTQGLSGKSLLTISNKDLGIKNRSMRIELTDTYRNHLWHMVVSESCILTWCDIEDNRGRNGYSRLKTCVRANSMSLCWDLSGGRGCLGKHL